MIVVDTNVISYMAFKTEQSPTVFNLHVREDEWHVPVLWRSEFLNVVALYFRRKLISHGEALQAFDFVEKLVGFNEHAVASESVLELVVSSKCSSYDCEFVALAKALNTKLLTYDKQILQEFPNIAVKPEDYLNQL